MAGTLEGGRKAAARNKLLYGMNFYSTIGRLGGIKSRGGGFASDKDKAREAGRKGGLMSRINKEKCKRGHDLSGKNVRIFTYGAYTFRRCVACEKIRKQERVAA